MSKSINIEVDKVCRTCLTPSEDMTSLYETCSSTMKICFAEFLSTCTPIKCDANDGLPKQLCHNCTDELSRFYIFQLKCVESNGVLQSYLEKQIKIEETNDFEMLIKTEFDADGSIYFVENSSNSNDVFTNLKSLKNPLDISELQKELEQTLDIIKHEIKHEEIDEIQRDLIPKINQTSTTSCHIDLSTQARIENPYSCGICNCTFKAKNNLTVHMRKHNRKKPYSCPTCFSSFNRKSYFAVHLRTHTGERPYSCQVCERSFNEKSALTVHMRMHTNERPFPCTVCESSFKQKATLTAHMRKHNGEKPFSCRYCDLSFRQNAHLMTHLRTHTGEKPYWCSVCDRAFKQKISLTRHLRIHTGEKPYSCTNCGRTFTQKKTFQAHLTTHLEAQSG